MNYMFRSALALPLLFLYIIPMAQTGKREKEKPKNERSSPEHHKTAIEYSLDTIMQRLDNMHITLNNINEFQDRGFDTRKVQAQLPEIDYYLQTIASNLSLDNSVPEIKNLQLFGVMLGDMKEQLETWRASLFKYNNDLINMNAEIDAFTKDSVIHQVVKDSMFRKMYTDEVRELGQKWVEANKSTQKNLTKINQLQSGVSEQYFQTIDLENRVVELKKQVNDKLFSKEYNYLWEPADSIVSGTQTGDLAARSYRGQRGIMHYFIQQHWDDYIYVLLIGLVFFFWVWHNFRLIRQSPDRQKLLDDLHLRYLHFTPFITTLVVILNIIPFFDLDAPALYIQLVQFFLLIALSILFWRRWPTRYFLYWLGIALLFVLFSATGAVLVPMMNVRLWLLLLNILSATLGYIAIRRIIRAFSFNIVVKTVSVIYLVLNILAALCNLSGRLSLAKLFSTTAIFGLVQIIGLSVFIDCLLEVLALQAAVTKTKDKTTRPTFIYERMQKGLFRLLMVFSVFTWLIVFAINLNIYDTIYSYLDKILNTTKTFGSISFRLGNIFIFVLIIYLSNLLQKYVGYLFGATDPPDPAHMRISPGRRRLGTAGRQDHHRSGSAGRGYRSRVAEYRQQPGVRDHFDLRTPLPDRRLYRTEQQEGDRAGYRHPLQPAGYRGRNGDHYA
jgi:potassium efflux system protein